MYVPVSIFKVSCWHFKVYTSKVEHRPGWTAVHLKWNEKVLGTGRGEVVEDVAPPLPLATPLLLVKPREGLATPAVFRALDLAGRSTADPRALLAALAASRSGNRACLRLSWGLVFLAHADEGPGRSGCFACSKFSQS